MYGAPGQRGVFDCVVTCFFLDTAHNVIAYMETIWHALRVGNKGHSGVWGVHRLGYKPGQRGAIDCVATHVLLDTAHNVIAYMDTVWHALRVCPPTWVTNFISAGPAVVYIGQCSARANAVGCAGIGQGEEQVQQPDGSPTPSLRLG